MKDLEFYANRAVLAYFESDDSKYARARLAQAMWNLKWRLEMNDKKDETIHTYSTGAKRSERMHRYDLIPKVATERLAKRFTGELDSNNNPTGGALKYGEFNWEKGLPTSDVINHIIDHLLRYQEIFRKCLAIGIRLGYKGDELMNYVRHQLVESTRVDDDLAGAMWGISVLMYQEENGMFHDDLFEIK